VHISKTPIARHQNENVAQHVSSMEQLSTKTADRHAHARSYHHHHDHPCTKVYLVPTSVPASRAWRSANIWEKQICLKIQQRQRNAKWFQSLSLPPSGSFNSKEFKGFFNISGRLGEVQPLKILLAARSINFSGPPKIRTISAPGHLYNYMKCVLRTFTNFQYKQGATRTNGSNPLHRSSMVWVIHAFLWLISRNNTKAARGKQ